jgi:hypothetical protein
MKIISLTLTENKLILTSRVGELVSCQAVSPALTLAALLAGSPSDPLANIPPDLFDPPT